MNSFELLGDEGPFKSQLPGFAERRGQQELAGRVEAAIASSQTLIAEAGTGTGKTLAYLVPAVSSGKRIIFSTGTKTLQDQLYFRDLPLVRKALADTLTGTLTSALLKGRANYYCRYRANQFRQSGLLNSPNAVTTLQQVHAWSAETVDGDLSTANVLPDDSPLWPQVTSTIDNCLGSECPDYQDCFVVKARRKAQDAQCVVVNHHLLFADLAVKQTGFGEILPGADAIIVDEAHLVPEIASRFFSRSFSSRQILDLLRDSLSEAGKQSGMLAAIKPLVDECRHCVLQSQSLFAELLPLSGEFTRLQRNRRLWPALGQVIDGLTALREQLHDVESPSQGLESCLVRTEQILERWSQLDGEPSESEVIWFERRGRGFLIHCTPLDVADVMDDCRAELGSTWIFTSATLTVRQSFEHFQHGLGLQDADTFLADSEFDYRSNALIWLPDDLPDPGAADYTERLLDTVLPLIEANDGRAFLLFTSHRALQIAAEWLEERIDFPLFIQGRASRTQLLESFRGSGNGVLLGAASFWEGVDVVGPALSLVVIDKLPFAAPNDPVLSARSRLVRKQGHHPFQVLQLPQAVIALKQGAGRLIRDVHDRGVLVLGDPRIRSRSYGRIFLDSLPPMRKTLDLDAALEFLSE